MHKNDLALRVIYVWISVSIIIVWLRKGSGLSHEIGDGILY